MIDCSFLFFLSSFFGSNEMDDIGIYDALDGGLTWRCWGEGWGGW